MRIAILATLLLSAGELALMAQAEPALEREGDTLILLGLPGVLDDPQISSQLPRGLTTTFTFRVDLLDQSGSDREGGARIEIRYELWDEVYKVGVIGIDGRPGSHDFPSPESLRLWWSDLRLPVLDVGNLSASLGGRARVTLQIIPFSRAEATDTQRWFAESVRRAELAKAGTSAAISDQSSDAGGVLDLLLATSIRRRPLTSYRWLIDLPSGPAP